jgi:hypothetical protein
MTDFVWKRRERAVARLFGGRRIPVTGLDRHGADVDTPRLLIQVKHGHRRPAFLKAWLDGICDQATHVGRVGVVVWTTAGEPTADAVVVLRAVDLKALLASGNRFTTGLEDGVT